MTVELICANNLDVLPTLEAESVPLIITDPPYGIGYHSNRYKEKNPYAPVARDWNFQIGGFLQECTRILKDGGALYLFCRWDVAPLWIPHISGNGLKLKTAIAWVKDNWSAGDLKGCFGNQYEQILFIVKGRHLLRGKRWSNVWMFPRVPPAQMLMPTQKPVELLERAILSSSDEGDLVIDPFCGSSSAAVAALKTGRDAMMIDIDSRMIAISQKRLGFPVMEERPRIESPAPRLEVPDPGDWGIHPEELQAIWALMQNNAEHIQPEVIQAEMELA